MATEILEGFLCPLCMKDLGDVIQLQIHFEENHSKEDQAFVSSLKELFGKAKKKILNEEEQQASLDTQLTANKVLLQRRNDSIDPVSGIRRDIFRDFQPAPPNSSHFKYFKKIRSDRVDRVAAETNRLIVRLDRLLDNIPAEAAKRRAHEQGVVQWVEEELVKLCPGCARSFNIARRKHHCRLCGSVICKECSRFAEWTFCRKLINPSTLSIYSLKSRERQGWSVTGSGGPGSDTRSVGSLAKPSFRLRRSNSKESVQSLLSIGGEGRGTEEFRTCQYCLKLLKHRDAAIELQSSTPIVSQFYDKLRELTVQGTELSEKYMTMSDSLWAGETTYHLQDAKTLRMKLLKLAEAVDLMSKKIAGLGTDTADESFLSSRRYLLQNQIRRASVNFIKETLVGLPSLPSDEEVVKLQSDRQEEMARRVEEERRKASEARIRFRNLQEKRSEATNSPQSRSDQSVKYEAGFVLSSFDQDELSASEDPMVQQMNIIRSYIAKAREANRYDEVSMLEKNLKELQLEYRRSRAVSVAASAAPPSTSSPSSDLSPTTTSSPYSSPARLGSQSTNPFDETDAASPPPPRGPNHVEYESFNLPHSASAEEVGGPGGGRSTMDSAKPSLEQMATRTVNTVRDYLPNKSLLTNLNPFGADGSPRNPFASDGANPFGSDNEEDEYDASGKNPFSE